jgi:uncharacterized protein (TIGR03435 family)
MRPAILIGVLALTTGLAAQAPLAFEVASIRLNASGATATTLGFQQNRRFRAVNEPLWRLVAEAYRTTYQLRRFEILGLPEWINSERFDVDAVAGEHATPEEARKMLQHLLEDRFKLVVRRTTRELPIYQLVRARSDGRLGDRLKRSDVDCSTRPLPAPAPGQPRPCVMVFGQGHLSSNGMTIAQLAEMGLARSVERPVLERTGLTGGYQWTLEWAPDGSTDSDRPTLITALQEQLGLKLESTRGRVEVLMIDSVSRPTPD